MSEAQRLAQQRRQLIQTLKDAMADAHRFGIYDDLGIAEMQANRLWPDWQSREQVTRQAEAATRRGKHDLLFAKAVIDGSIADIEAVDDDEPQGDARVPAWPTYEAGQAGAVPEDSHQHEWQLKSRGKSSAAGNVIVFFRRCQLCGTEQPLESGEAGPPVTLP